MKGPTLAEIEALQSAIKAAIHRTPMVRCFALEEALGPSARVFAKLEFLQRTGTFKARGALATIRTLSEAERRAGVTAVSAGNHAIATAFAARASGISAKVVMIRAASPVRIEACRDFDAEVVLADDVHQAFEIAEAIQTTEGRYFVHPFEGPAIATGTGTLGLEIHEQCKDFDTLLVPVGGGGLIAGVANAVRQLRPECEIIGVEPEGADSMHRSFASGEPEGIDKVRTIADSLGAPFAMPYSFELTRRNVDSLVMIDDDQMRRAMGLLFESMRVAVEPACAATTAALLGPLRDRLATRRTAIVMCGSNIDWQTFQQQAIFEA
ncbi:MAG: threonine/serine dehydratase, partial [Gammaproteobacteria bacterium]|nr:threonine/serine dehydratase [Gammaproteobacteria bacterium]